jgi:hypothetical protein
MGNLRYGAFDGITEMELGAEREGWALRQRCSNWRSSEKGGLCFVATEMHTISVNF